MYKKKLNNFFKAIFMFLIYSSLFFLNSCYAPQKGSSTGSSLTGTEGLRFSFLNNAPPSIIYADDYSSSVPISVEVFNKGTFAPTNIETAFVGFDENLVSVQELQGIDFTEEDVKTRYNPEGGYAIGESFIDISNLNNAEEYNFVLKLIYCYDYSTIANVPVCIDPNPNRQSKEDACTPGSVSTSGQGAPVSVSSVNVESMYGKTRIKINIQANGNVQVINPEIGSCIGPLRRLDEDVLRLNAVRLGAYTGNCNPNEGSTVRLKNGAGNIICTFDITDTEQQSFKTLLYVDLSYKIKGSIEKNIKVINDIHK